MQLKHISPATVLSVDLEGALLRTDLTLELFLDALRTKPLALLGASFRFFHGRFFQGRFFQGKSQIRAELSKIASLDPAALAYAPDLMDHIREQHAEGRAIELVSTLEPRHAQAIADHLDLFDTVTTFASEAEKADYLAARQAQDGYAAPSMSPEQIVSSRPLPSAYIEALRPHQWTKNLLIFVPMALAHRFDEPLAWLMSFAAFAAFCMAASAIYLINDLLDAPADIKHASKRHRPIASGRVDRRIAAMAVAPLLGGAMAAAAAVSSQLLVVILIYIAVTTAYSLVLKRKMLWDVFTLAALYTMRIIAGAVAIDKSLSFWLLAFSVFTFLSLALVKRFVELSSLAENSLGQSGSVSGRGYRLCDIETLHQVGIASCFSGVLVFALYINSRVVEDMYRTPQALWLICPALLYLLLRFWMLARRNEMHDDPVVFALRDTRSQLVLLGIAVAAIGAKFL